MADMSSPLAPGDRFPERVSNVWEAKMAPNAPGGRGPMHFEEGIATDTDVPNDFVLGMRQGYETGPRPNMNKNVFEKLPAETTQERAHVGSASWVEAPDYLGAFAGGTSNEAERKFIQVNRGAGLGQKWHRQDAAVVTD
jgi:hypothetical protein